MKPFFISLLLSCLLAPRLYAQKPVSRTSDEYAMHLPLSIFIEPSGLISLYNNSSARFGIEVPISRNRFSLVQVNCLYPDGYGIKGVIKCYFDNGSYIATKHPAWSNWQRHYIALEYFYKAYQYDNSDSIKYPPYGERTYHVEKFATTVSVMVGGINTWKNGLYWEWFAGGGVRVKTVNNDLADGETDKFYHWHEGMSQGPTDGKVRDGVGPHISLGVRLGWRYR